MTLAERIEAQEKRVKLIEDTYGSLNPRGDYQKGLLDGLRLAQAILETQTVNS